MLVPLTTMEERSTSHGRIGFLSLSDPSKVASSQWGRFPRSFSDAAFSNYIFLLLWLNVLGFPVLWLLIFFTVNISPAMPFRWPGWKVSKGDMDHDSSKFDAAHIHCFLLLSLCLRIHSWLLHHCGWNLPLQKTLLTLSKVILINFLRYKYDVSCYLTLICCFSESSVQPTVRLSLLTGHQLLETTSTQMWVIEMFFFLYLLNELWWSDHKSQWRSSRSLLIPLFI